MPRCVTSLRRLSVESWFVKAIISLNIHLSRSQCDSSLHAAWAIFNTLYELTCQKDHGSHPTFFIPSRPSSTSFSKTEPVILKSLSTLLDDFRFVLRHLRLISLRESYVLGLRNTQYDPAIFYRNSVAAQHSPSTYPPRSWPTDRFPLFHQDSYLPFQEIGSHLSYLFHVIVSFPAPKSGNHEPLHSLHAPEDPTLIKELTNNIDSPSRSWTSFLFGILDLHDPRSITFARGRIYCLFLFHYCGSIGLSCLSGRRYRRDGRGLMYLHGSGAVEWTCSKKWWRGCADLGPVS